MKSFALAGLCVCLISLAAAQAPAPLTIAYNLDLTHPANHLIGVTIQAAARDGGALPASLQLLMPAWYPGRYSIYNYAVNVQNLAAQCASDPAAAIKLTRLGPSRWQIDSGGCHALTVSYRVYANTLTGSFAQLDRTHANVNGGPVFAYFAGHKADPVSLRIAAPEGWKVLDELGAPGQTTLTFPNYDIFIDAPIEAAPNFSLDNFVQDGRTYRILIHSYRPEGGNHGALIAALRRIVAVENTVFGPPADLRTYSFFFHFDPQSPGDGMEHLFGTQIIIPAALGEPAGLRGAEDDAAHEFFHQWNVKRLRPLPLGPWDYQRPDPTRSLWIAEGLTQYYGDISVERAGLESPEEYLRQLGGSFGRFEQQPGHASMSAADSSLTAWFHDRTPLYQETNQRATTISYYQKGELLGAMLDLDLRRRSAGRLSLDTVMRYMYQHFYEGPRASYYLPGRGYREADFEAALETVSGVSYQDFFARYVNGVAELPFNDYVAAAGLQVECSIPPDRKSFTGLVTEGTRVVMVAPDSPAARAGLGVDDEITAINGQTVGADAADVLRALPPGQPAVIAVTEHFQAFSATITPEPPHRSRCAIVPRPDATVAEKALRESWLGTPRG
ncbi:MAG TPA: PDZ domain-containing protein [Terriglobales bacterium]|nr:PDZ domain-containing protein [Terriglobales bacterium]